MNNKEIELRGFLEKEQYIDLIKELSNGGCVHEKDDKVSYFFAREKGIFKINDEISKDQVKISLKLGDEETGSLHEKEVVLSRLYFDDMFFIFKSLGFDKFHKVEQKRDNFYLKEYDVELAIKYTPDFKYHFEIEYLGKDFESDDEIKNHLKNVCIKLNIKPLEEKELLQKIKDIKRKYKLN